MSGRESERESERVRERKRESEDVQGVGLLEEVSAAEVEAGE